MKNRIVLIKIVICLLFSLVFHNLFSQCADIIVAADGSGDYIKIQDAVAAAPENGTIPFVIFIKNGIYDEQIFIEKNFITLIGESRKETVITTAVLRRVWRENNPSDWGAATINISSNATDLTFANMTIQNNFAEVFPDFPNNNDHTFAIRGGGNRVIILNCDVVTTGGDTLSLWNTDGGMFYHNNCFFEGYVDYVAPRGYCYITDSQFFGYNKNASIWHDGNGGADHKLVIRRSVFDGIPGFALGRHHKEAAFYLLDCIFEDHMKTTGIEYVRTDPLVWGQRYYYHNTHRRLIDFSWHKDNLHEAVGNPAPEDINALWTFNGLWNPKSLLDGLLPFAFLPNPRSGTACVSTQDTLSWTAANCAIEYQLYFGNEANPPFYTTVTEPRFTPEGLEENTQYFWRVDVVTPTDTVIGEIWSFRTDKENNLPDRAFAPSPPDSADYITNLTKLDWQYFLCSVDSFEVWLGESPDDLQKVNTQKYPGYFITSPKDDTEYFWRIDTKNHNGKTEGKVWRFNRNPTSSTKEFFSEDTFFIKNFPNPFRGKTTLHFAIPESGVVNISVYDSDGKLIKSIIDSHFEVGSHFLEISLGKKYSGAAFLCKLRFRNKHERNVKLISH